MISESQSTTFRSCLRLACRWLHGILVAVIIVSLGPGAGLVRSVDSKTPIEIPEEQKSVAATGTHASLKRLGLLISQQPVMRRRAAATVAARRDAVQRGTELTAARHRLSNGLCAPLLC